MSISKFIVCSTMSVFLATSTISHAQVGASDAQRMMNHQDNEAARAESCRRGGGSYYQGSCGPRKNAEGGSESSGSATDNALGTLIVGLFVAAAVQSYYSNNNSTSKETTANQAPENETKPVSQNESAAPQQAPSTRWVNPNTGNYGYTTPRRDSPVPVHYLARVNLPGNATIGMFDNPERPRLIMKLRGGDRGIKLFDCEKSPRRANWCRVEYRGVRGWTSDEYLVSDYRG